jgi:hypothetical protein
MQWLNAAVDLQRKIPAAVVRRWGPEPKGRSHSGMQDIANACRTIRLVLLFLASFVPVQ